ncbi:unnamed protein product [Ambrosiozyma monospora]|uniref:Unnamed protein product n=1 Tax=Ambrosiozyma monospora TaxID=43982 RepID=A0A9W6YWF1_AMBMO|nr:unnamed protein product [Ambrosiozyma monospora]
MKHPFQKIALNKKGDLFFAASGNSLFAYQLSEGKPTLVGSWTDELDADYKVLKAYKAQLALMQQQAEEKKQQSTEESANDDSGEPAKKIQKTQKAKKLPKMPKAGPGAPPTFTYIRDVKLSRKEDHLIITTDNDKAVVVFELDFANASEGKLLKFIKRQPFPKRPSCVVTSLDDTEIFLSDKFGDVYKISLLDTKIYKEDELEPILGHVSMLTCIDSVKDSEGKEYIVTSDRDEHLRITNYPLTHIVKKWLFGHEEFISGFVLPHWLDNKVIVSAGGDPFLCNWKWEEYDVQNSNNTLQKVDFSKLVEPYITDKHLAPSRFQNETNDLKEFSVSNIVASETLKRIVVVVERTPVLFLFKFKEDGTLEFDKKYETKADIVSVASSDNDKLIVSIDDREQQLEIFTIKGEGELVKEANEPEVISEINRLNTSVVDSPEDVVPLFMIWYLRKRSEH